MGPGIKTSDLLNYSRTSHPGSRARVVCTANRIAYVGSRTDPGVAHGRRNISVVDVVLDRINEIGQLLTCRTWMPLINSIFSGLQFRDQALLLRSAERRSVDGCLQVLDCLEHGLHRDGEAARR